MGMKGNPIPQKVPDSLHFLLIVPISGETSPSRLPPAQQQKGGSSGWKSRLLMQSEADEWFSAVRAQNGKIAKSFRKKIAAMM